MNITPETCGNCEGSGVEPFVFPKLLEAYKAKNACPFCHGRGTVYPHELVVRVLLALPFYLSEDQLVAVLDALNTEPA